MGERGKQTHVRQQYGKAENETFTDEFVRRREKGKMITTQKILFCRLKGA